MDNNESHADAQEFTAALAQVWAGAARLTTYGADRLRIPERLGYSAEEWAQRRLLGPARFAFSERRTLSPQLTAPIEVGGAGLSNRQAAKVLGVDEGTVRNDRRAEHSADASQSQAWEEAYGAEHSAPEPTPPLLSPDERMAAARAKQQYTAAMKQIAAGLVPLHAEVVAPLLTAADWRAAELHRADLVAWFQRLFAARITELQLVEGSNGR